VGIKDVVASKLTQAEALALQMQSENSIEVHR